MIAPAFFCPDPAETRRFAVSADNGRTAGIYSRSPWLKRAKSW